MRFPPLQLPQNIKTQTHRHSPLQKPGKISHLPRPQPVTPRKCLRIAVKMVPTHLQPPRFHPQKTSIRSLQLHP